MVTGGRTVATATFDTIDRQGPWPSDTWTGDAVGAGDSPITNIVGFQQAAVLAADAVTITGSGDIAPDTGGSGTAIERTLSGAFGALAVVAVLAVLFVTSECRRGMIRLTLAANPRRGRVLAAKAIVVGAVTFVAALISAAVTVAVSQRILEANGNFVYPITWITELRVVAGTAAVLAVSATSPWPSTRYSGVVRARWPRPSCWSSCLTSSRPPASYRPDRHNGCCA
jgi:hypothetical protein